MNPEQVQSRKNFIDYIDSLRLDLVEHPDTWENATLERFLEAFSAYATDIDGYYKNNQIKIDANIPSWRVFADIFEGAKIYE